MKKMSHFTTSLSWFTIKQFQFKYKYSPYCFIYRTLNKMSRSAIRACVRAHAIIVRGCRSSKEICAGVMKRSGGTPTPDCVALPPLPPGALPPLPSRCRGPWIQPPRSVDPAGNSAHQPARPPTMLGRWWWCPNGMGPSGAN